MESLKAKKKRCFAYGFAPAATKQQLARISSPLLIDVIGVENTMPDFVAPNYLRASSGVPGFIEGCSRTIVRFEMKSVEG
jgi:hypothetical protein